MTSSTYEMYKKQSGVLGVTCRDSFVADERPKGHSGSGGCPVSSTGGGGGCPIGSQGVAGFMGGGCSMSPQGGGGCMGTQPEWTGMPPFMPGWGPGAGPGGWTPSCNCDESESESSTSSSSSSSESSADTQTTDKKSKTKEVEVNPNVSPWYNYEFCTCETPLPDAYIPKPKPKKKPPPPGPQAGIWCGSPCCAVAEYFPPKAKNVARNPLQLKLKEPSSAVPPGTCCFRNDQLIFQVPQKGHKSDSEVLPFYNVGPDEQPLGVKMMRPEENPELDPGNNTYIIKITKTDAKGKPAKMQLALKIPRPPDASVPENETPTQYNADDLTAGRPSALRGRKSKGGKRSTTKSVAWSKKTTTRKSTKSAKSKKSKVSKASKLNFSGAKKISKEYKTAGKK